jgi:hypothetical protein
MSLLDEVINGFARGLLLFEILRNVIKSFVIDIT